MSTPIQYTLGFVAIEQLRRAAREHGASAAELAAINRLDNFTAEAVDVKRLVRLAEIAGLPWRELFQGTLQLAQESA